MAWRGGWATWSGVRSGVRCCLAPGQCSQLTRRLLPARRGDGARSRTRTRTVGRVRALRAAGGVGIGCRSGQALGPFGWCGRELSTEDRGSLSRPVRPAKPPPSVRQPEGAAWARSTRSRPRCASWCAAAGSTRSRTAPRYAAWSTRSSPSTTSARSSPRCRRCRTEMGAIRVVYDAVVGFGPLHRHLDDLTVEEILDEPAPGAGVGREGLRHAAASSTPYVGGRPDVGRPRPPTSPQPPPRPPRRRRCAGDCVRRPDGADRPGQPGRHGDSGDTAAARRLLPMGARRPVPPAAAAGGCATVSAATTSRSPDLLTLFGTALRIVRAGRAYLQAADGPSTAKAPWCA